MTKKLSIRIVLCVLLVVSMMATALCITSAGDTTYTLAAGQTLATGDKVVLALDSAEGSTGVTGLGDNNNAAVSTVRSEWVQYTVTVVEGGYNFYDAAAEKYIATPTVNHFKYNATAGLITIADDGRICCNERYLYNNTNNGNFYRMYADKTGTTGYTPFLVYKVSGGAVVPVPAPTTTTPDEGETFSPITTSPYTAGTAYQLKVEQATAGKTLYFNGQLTENTYYLATTENKDEAVDIYVESVTGGFALSFTVGGEKKYLTITQSGTHFNASISDTAAVWQYAEDADTFVMLVGDEYYYIGCYNTYATISASKVTYITGENAANVDVTQFPARLSGNTVAPATGDSTIYLVIAATVALLAMGAVITGKNKKENA